MLNLHGASSVQLKNHNSLDSTSMATGYAISIGSWSHHLLNLENCDTFLSIDAGSSWRKILSGPRLCAVGAYGSIIVCSERMGTASAAVYYSLDDGKSWTSSVLFSEAVHIEFIAVESSSKLASFLISGNLIAGSSGKAKLAFINYSLLARECSMADIYQWQFNQNGTTRCLLGRRVKIARRRPDSACILRNHSANIDFEICECTENDFEWYFVGLK